MNVSLQLCGLVIAIFLLVIYKSHTTLGLKGERLFVIVILATIGCLTLDVLSVLAIHFRSSFPFFCVQLVCKAYLISMVWVGWGNFCYVTLDLNSDSRSHTLLCAQFFFNFGHSSNAPLSASTGLPAKVISLRFEHI